MEPNERVDHPAHYNAGRIEAIDVIEDWQLGFHLGSVLKYLARCAHKGDRLSDLKKAAWYLRREIARAEPSPAPGHALERALRDIADERRRQEELKAAGKFKHTPADPELSDDARYRILGEEVGEVAKALNERDAAGAQARGAHNAHIREELIQTAAVCAAWVERLDAGDA
jgi:uncharacterized protein DUF3310